MGQQLYSESIPSLAHAALPSLMFWLPVSPHFLFLFLFLSFFNSLLGYSTVYILADIVSSQCDRCKNAGLCLVWYPGNSLSSQPDMFTCYLPPISQRAQSCIQAVQCLKQAWKLIWSGFLVGFGRKEMTNTSKAVLAGFMSSWHS